MKWSDELSPTHHMRVTAFEIKEAELSPRPKPSGIAVGCVKSQRWGVFVTQQRRVGGRIRKGAKLGCAGEAWLQPNSRESSQVKIILLIL